MSEMSPISKSVYRYCYRKGYIFCCRCYTKLNITLDHIVPRSVGGSDEVDNMQLLCTRCHQMKSMVEYCVEYDNDNFINSYEIIGYTKSAAIILKCLI